MEKLVLLVYGAITFWAMVLLVALYFIGQYLFAPTVDASCAMWQREFQLCGDPVCFKALKSERPETCYPPQDT
mgnify:CR=1 FL=1